MIDSALFDVPCPHCGAGPLELCQTNGRYMESTVHGPRRIRAGVDLKPEPIAGPARPTIIGRNDPDKCRAGIHDWTEANVYTSPTGNRQCRPCRRENQRTLRRSARKNGGTHCRNGHEYNEANTHIQKNGQRRCRTCGAAAKRRQRGSTNSRPLGPLTRCKQGHEYTPINTYTTKTGARQCRTCKRARDNRANAKRRVTA